MKNKALFPGSFDPFTAGHLNILKRALTMFDEVVVAVGINQDKRSFFDMEKKLSIIREATRGLAGVSDISVMRFPFSSTQKINRFATCA